MSLIIMAFITIVAVASGGVTGSVFVFIAIIAVAAFVWAISKYVFFPGQVNQQQTEDLTEERARLLKDGPKSHRRGVIPLTLVGTVIALGAVYAAINYVLYPDLTIRYKLTAEVVMQDKTYTGSSVIETRWMQTIFNPLLLRSDWTERERGEAVVVDMAENGVVLVTFAGYPQQQPDLLPRMVFGQEEGASTFRGLLRAYGRDRRIKSVEPESVPVVVWLHDRLDPSTAICIEPTGSAPAVPVAPSFPRVQMQMVDELPTETIEAVLPWLRSRFSDPHDGGSIALINLNRRYPQRICHCTSRDLKRNTL